MRFLRLGWVANKSPGLAAKTLKDKIMKNFLSVFHVGRSTHEGVTSWAVKISVYPSRLDLSLSNKSPKLTRELAAEFHDLGDSRLSRQNRATLFLKFFSFCKNKILSKKHLKHLKIFLCLNQQRLSMWKHILTSTITQMNMAFIEHKLVCCVWISTMR